MALTAVSFTPRGRLALAVVWIWFVPFPLWAAISATGDVAPANPGSADPWNVADTLVVGQSADASLTVSDTSGVNSLAGTIAHSPGVVASVIVTGSGASWNNNQDLLIGVSGIGQLDVLDGAQVSNYGASLGHLSGSGAVLVMGADARWTTADVLLVGNAAQGTLTIRDAGEVISGAAQIGVNTAATGSVLVDGHGSTWAIFESLSLGQADDSGAASMALAGDGSRVYVGAAAVRDGDELPSNQTALVVSERGGIASLSIYHGNTIDNPGFGYIGVGEGEDGIVSVDGAGSAWNNDGEVAVGVAGAATLALLSGGSVSAGGGLNIGPHGTVRGTGAISGDVENSGTVAPGHSLGSLHVSGDFAQSASGRLQIELFGASASEYDQFGLAGAAALDGTLEVLLGESDGSIFVPQLGHSFTVLSASSISGEFASLVLPLLAPELVWHVATGLDNVTLSVVGAQLAGDYNGDGVVGAADYTVWRDTLGSTSDLRADGDGSCSITAADYMIWQQNFGAVGLTNSAGAAVAVALAVPEPSTSLALTIVLAASLTGLARRRVSRWVGRL